jgi:hypothetical protein
MFFKKGKGGAVGVYMEPRGRWTEKVWEPPGYSDTLGGRDSSDGVVTRLRDEQSGIRGSIPGREKRHLSSSALSQVASYPHGLRGFVSSYRQIP